MKRKKIHSLIDKYYNQDLTNKEEHSLFEIIDSKYVAELFQFHYFIEKNMMISNKLDYIYKVHEICNSYEKQRRTYLVYRILTLAAIFFLLFIFTFIWININSKISNNNLHKLYSFRNSHIDSNQFLIKKANNNIKKINNNNSIDNDLKEDITISDTNFKVPQEITAIINEDLRSCDFKLIKPNKINTYYYGDTISFIWEFAGNDSLFLEIHNNKLNKIAQFKITNRGRNQQKYIIIDCPGVYIYIFKTFKNPVRYGLYYVQ